MPRREETLHRAPIKVSRVSAPRLICRPGAATATARRAPAAQHHPHQAAEEGADSMLALQVPASPCRIHLCCGGTDVLHLNRRKCAVSVELRHNRYSAPLRKQIIFPQFVRIAITYVAMQDAVARRPQQRQHGPMGSLATVYDARLASCRAARAGGTGGVGCAAALPHRRVPCVSCTHEARPSLQVE